jgi:hypothetical protein
LLRPRAAACAVARRTEAPAAEQHDELDHALAG